MPVEPKLDVNAILRAVGIVHAPAIVYGREGQPTVIDDGMVRLELVEDASGWQWRRNGQDRGALEGLEHLTRILATEAERYGETTAVQRTRAARNVEALCAQWLDETDDLVGPRPWGICVPGRPLDGPQLRQWVLFDTNHDVTVGRISSEVSRLHPDAYLCFGQDMPLMVDDGMSSMLFFERQDGWRYSLDGIDCGRVEDHLDLQVILSERAKARAAAPEEERTRAAEYVEELSRLPFTERYTRARKRAMTRGARAGSSVEDTVRVPVPEGLRVGARS